jgi:predicted aminopeptidase
LLGAWLALMRWAALLLAGCDTFAWGGCKPATTRQSVAGHLDLVRRARPVDDWIAAADTAPALKARLELTRRIRDFAVDRAEAARQPSYRRYAAWTGPAAVWNVVAAPDCR